MNEAWQRLRVRLINLYPPLLGAGIRARQPDAQTIEVSMPLTPFNVNLVGVHFGGSLYAMCDPWFMILLIRALGPGYIVWDKAASIRFLKPGRGRVRARFHILEEQVREIRQQADSLPKLEPVFSVDVLAEDGSPVARVEKVLYVRRKTEPAG